MTADSSTDSWSASNLERRIQSEDDFFVFDVRNEDEFEAWKIEGREPIETVNVPYYEMLEVDEFDDVVDTFEDFLKRGWMEKLPTDRPILTVCAKGDTSEYVAAAMRRLGLAAVNLEGGTRAWGDYYAKRPVEDSDVRSIFQVARPARGCLSYVVISDGEAVVIDALRHFDHYVQVCEEEGAEIVAVLDTHGHADHISGGPALASQVGAPYYLHPFDGIHPIDVLPATLAFEYIEDGMEFSIGNSRLQAIHIPGHTLGNVAFLLDSEYLFTGDSIFIESIARPDLGGHGDTWAPLHYESLQLLMRLPDDVTVLPGHFSTLNEADENGIVESKLGGLKRRNSGLLKAQGAKEDFVEYILASLPEFPEQYVDIKRVNAGLKQPNEEEASELELGKNVCALAD